MIYNENQEYRHQWQSKKNFLKYFGMGICFSLMFCKTNATKAAII